MSYPPNQQPPYGAPTPPAPPPKTSQQLSTPPPVPPHPFQQHQNAFPHSQSPVYSSSSPPHAHPGPYQPSPNPAAASPGTSTWNAPYPPDEGLRRLNPESSAGPQRQNSHPQQQPQPQQQQQQQQQQQWQGPPAYQHQPHSPQQYQAPQQREQYQLPASIQSKPIPDLSALLADPELLNALLNSPETQPTSLANSTAHLNSCLQTNMDLAQSLSNLDESLRAARETTSANLLRLRGLETAWKKKQTILERKLEPWGPRELHQRLGAAISEGDGMCSALEASFIDASGGGGGLADEREVTEWIRHVREGRKTVALRRERKRRWDEGRVGGWR